MSAYQWFSVLGVQAFFTALSGMIVGIINTSLQRKTAQKQATREDVEMLKKAMQLSLRKNLFDMYQTACANQSVTSDEQMLFLSIYECYHGLGSNGVMDEVKEQYLKFKVIN